MSEMIDAMTIGLTNREPAVSEDSSLSEILSALVRTAGSGKGAAALLGISDTTFYRWKNHADGAERGIQQAPSQGRRTMITKLRAAQLSPAVRHSIKTGGRKMVISATVTVSNDTRRRTLHVGENITPRRMNNVINSWQVGDDERAERLLLKAIDEQYAPGMEFESVDYMEFR